LPRDIKNVDNFRKLSKFSQYHCNFFANKKERNFSEVTCSFFCFRKLQHLRCRETGLKEGITNSNCRFFQRLFLNNREQVHLSPHKREGQKIPTVDVFRQTVHRRMWINGVLWKIPF
jgi:hypothetical protein